MTVAQLTNLDRSMAKVYARRIQRGEIAIDAVPERIRALVSEIVGE